MGIIPFQYQSENSCHILHWLRLVMDMLLMWAGPKWCPAQSLTSAQSQMAPSVKVPQEGSRLAGTQCFTLSHPALPRMRRVLHFSDTLVLQLIDQQRKNILTIAANRKWSSSASACWSPAQTLRSIKATQLTFSLFNFPATFSGVFFVYLKRLYTSFVCLHCHNWCMLKRISEESWLLFNEQIQFWTERSFYWNNESVQDSNCPYRKNGRHFMTEMKDGLHGNSPYYSKYIHLCGCTLAQQVRDL